MLGNALYMTMHMALYMSRYMTGYTTLYISPRSFPSICEHLVDNVTCTTCKTPVDCGEKGIPPHAPPLPSRELCQSQYLMTQAATAGPALPGRRGSITSTSNATLAKHLRLKPRPLPPRPCSCKAPSARLLLWQHAAGANGATRLRAVRFPPEQQAVTATRIGPRHAAQALRVR